MKSSALLEEIKSRVDIVDFISDYVALKKAGQNYKGLCPFHAEKTPSFMVSRSKQIFHCFGCGAGGDIVSFIMKHDNLSFGDALRLIAKKAGVPVPEPSLGRTISARRHSILQANEAAMQFYVRMLRSAPLAMTYLKKRGILDDTIHRFRIGYAPEQRNGLVEHLRKGGFPDAAIVGAGLAVAEGRGYRDWFRGRIIFPIWNARGDVVAFGGRVMGTMQPKYINTPETEVFKKSETLFGINFAKEEIRRSKMALIVEGYLDVTMCHQHGFTNAVAPLGTALTARHVALLKAFAENVILIFDGDDAGRTAARRSLSLCAEHGLPASVLLLPKGEDPDSFLRKHGSEPFRTLLSSAQSPIAFLLNSASGRPIDAVRDALAVIASVKDALYADEMIRELSDRSKVHETALRTELERLRAKAHRKDTGESPLTAPAHRREELILLSAILAFPEKAMPILSRLAPDDIADPTIRAIFVRMQTLGGEANVSALLEAADDAERALITRLVVQPGFDPEHVDANIADCLLKIRQRHIEQERRAAEDTGDVARLDSLLKEKRALSRRHCS